MKNKAVSINHNVAIAKKYGLVTSAVFYYVCSLIEKNKKNQCNNLNNKTYTEQITPQDISSGMGGILSEKQVKNSLTELEKEGFIATK